MEGFLLHSRFHSGPAGSLHTRPPAEVLEATQLSHPRGLAEVRVEQLQVVHQPRSSEPVAALQDVDFEVGHGEFVSIVGPSGCGKTTLLDVIAGLVEPSGGRILINGTEVKDRKRHFGYMFQRDLLFPWRTIRDNVALGLEVLGSPKREARQSAIGILEKFGLAGFAHRYPSQLSGGMRQRAALMRTLLVNRQVLLLDEPFGALDALTRSQMQEWLLELWEKDHRTVIFVTHDVEEAIFLADRVLVMTARPGRIKTEANIELSRPRDYKVLTSAPFNELKALILKEIHAEISTLHIVESSG